jgi:hypothetical protein
VEAMKFYVILSLIVLAVVAAFYVVFMNRSSEKIISAVIPITVAAIVGIFIAVFIFGREAPTTIRFPVTFFYRTSDNIPLKMPLRRLQSFLFIVPQLNQRHPELMKDNARGEMLYHHFLQRAMIEILVSRYQSDWEKEIVRFRTSTGEEMRVIPSSFEPKKKFRLVSSSEIKAALQGNRFADIETALPQFILPPDTSLSMMPPIEREGRMPEGTITLANEYVRLTIQTQPSTWGELHGGYQAIMGNGNKLDPNIMESTFILTVTTNFCRLRTGHPDMKRYRKWASQVVAEIQHDLDEQILWQETKDDYSSRQLEHLGPVPDGPLILNPPQVKNP